MLEWTGERYLPFLDPEISGAEIHYEHLHRYAFATQFVKGKKVLDFASGEGYGSYMLSKEAELVIGVEIDEKSVKHASSTYIRDNLKFMQGSILKVPIEGEKLFDAIICFEAMEHVEEHEELMKEVKRLLRDDGIFIVSSPNKKVYTDDPDYHNPFHQKELYFDEFKNLLKKSFTNIFFFGQRIYTASNLWRLTSEEVPNYSEFVIKKGDDEFYFSDGKNPLYFIAVASNADLNERYNMCSYLVDASNILIEDYKRQINEFNVAISGKEEEISNLEGEITNISNQLKEKERQINELDVAVRSKDAQISDFEGQITNISGQLDGKEQQIKELYGVIHSNDAQISDFEGQITDISGQLDGKEQQIKELYGVIHSNDAQISDFEGQITDISGQLDEREQQIKELYGVIHSKDAQISDLEGQITDISGQLDEREQQINVLNVAVRDRDARILNLEGQITTISGQLKDEEERLIHLEMAHVNRYTELNSMKSSVTWRAVMKWHSLVEWLLPPGTRRRGWYDLSVIGLRTIANDGWKSFWWSYKQHRATKMSFQSTAKSAPIVSQPLATPSKVLDEKVDLINKKVSIVIPTKNAGSEFEFTLERLKTQKGIEEIELVIVDSGSRDETVKLAEKYGASSYSIRPEEFNHGLTRNYGAEQATGDYFLFMVQDAIPIGNYWLYDMVNVLEKDPQIAAATCRQVPRSDADLFACFSLWTHYHSLLNFQEYRTAEPPADFDNLPAYEKRQLCGLDNVATIVRSDVFAQLKFSKIQYAEDLDLGVRLLKAGYKLAFLHSVGVVHTHNRDASYILRRYYVDTKIQQGLFNYKEYDLDINFDSLIYSILVMYSALNLSVEALKVSLHRTSDANRYINAIMKLEALIQENVKVAEIRFDGDPLLNDLFHKINEVVKVRRTDKGLMKLLVSRYLTFLNMLKEFVMIHSSNEEELIDTFYKLFSSVIATVFACSLPEYEDNRAHMLERLLEVGV